MLAVLTTALIITVKRSQHQARIDRSIVTCAVDIKGGHGLAINYLVAFVRKFFSTRRIIVIWTKPAVHTPLIVPLRTFFLIGNSPILRSIRQSLKRGKVCQIMSVLNEMERKRKEKSGESKIEMTNDRRFASAQRIRPSALIRHFNLDSAGEVCSALRRANRRDL